MTKQDTKFKKGRTKTGGRQKGTPNKTPAPIKEAIAGEWEKYHSSGQFQTDLQALEPHVRISVMEKFAQYIIPKMKNIDMDLKAEASTDLTQRLAKLVAETQSPTKGSPT